MQRGVLNDMNSGFDGRSGGICLIHLVISNILNVRKYPTGL